jgi:transposase InsO family protein
LWARFDRLPERAKARARCRLAALDAAAALEAAGMTRRDAFAHAAAANGCSVRNLWRWHGAVAGHDRADWLPLLAPAHRGRAATAEVSAEAWDYFRSDYLRPEQPCAQACYARLNSAASPRGWTVPALKTLMRRLEREVPRPAIILARQGADALKRAYPAQQRDRSVFRALEAVNADGHKFDVFVRWPSGEIARPVALVWQDLLSGMILSHRVDRTENADLVRLAFGDVVEAYGIPAHAYLDNGRGFASKWMTGRMTHRFRFKVMPEEPAGILTTLLGPDGVHWCTPYQGQAKPIERAFRDLCEYVSRHPALAGAYTGNKPDAKPENYGSRAVPLDEFLALLTQEIAAHNARAGRRGGVCQGRSFHQVFAESYQNAPIKKATAEQRRLFLLAAEGVSGSRVDGSVHLGDNRYWSEPLAQYAGKPLVVRFDPQQLHGAVYCYTPDGRYIGSAPCVQAAGFNDTQAAREHARSRKHWMRAQRDALAAERRMSAIEVAAKLPATPAPAAPPQSKVVRPVFGRKARHDAEVDVDNALARAIAGMKPDCL